MGLVMVVAGALVAYRFNTHVRARIITWVNPWPYVRQPRPRHRHHVVATRAGADRRWPAAASPARGWARARPTLIPVAHTDFIFSAFGEELGLLGAMFILACYLVLAYRGLRIAALARDPFDKLLAAGLTSAVVIQALVIIGGNIRLIPIAGVTLPFMSYGPSSLLSNFIIIGMLLRISANASASRVTMTHRPQAREARAPIPGRVRPDRGVPVLLAGRRRARHWSTSPRTAGCTGRNWPSTAATIYDRNGVVLAQTTFDGSGAPYARLPVSLARRVCWATTRSPTATRGWRSAYNDYLNGQGVLQPVDNTIRRLLHEPIVGDDLHLTIDARIQQIVTAAMGTGPGACIVADPRTGRDPGHGEPALDRPQPRRRPGLLERDERAHR